MTPERLAILILDGLNQHGYLPPGLTLNHPVDVIAAVIRGRIVYGDVTCILDNSERKMPALTAEDRKKMLGRQTYVCSSCDIRPYKDYCRQCDEFFYQCWPDCPQCFNDHEGHRVYDREDESADGWLVKNKKKPFALSHAQDVWYWGTEDDKDPDDPDSDDMLLPPGIFSRLTGQLTYPNCKRYESRRAALDDFRAAYVE